jgi:NDP-sugar pyrophosphorylase family protein
MKKLFLALTLFLFSSVSFADCVVSAKSAMRFSVIDSHTIILKGIGRDILIKTLSFIYPSSSVTILKDSFCDYENAVLYIDGQVSDVTQVKNL